MLSQWRFALGVMVLSVAVWSCNDDESTDTGGGTGADATTNDATANDAQPSDAGFEDGSTDAGSEPDASEDAGSPDVGIDAGPTLCWNNTECAPMQECVFWTGGCVQGICEDQCPPVDASVQYFCDCTGNTFTGGCVTQPWDHRGMCSGDGGTPDASDAGPGADI